MGEVATGRPATLGHDHGAAATHQDDEGDLTPDRGPGPPSGSPRGPPPGEGKGEG